MRSTAAFLTFAIATAAPLAAAEQVPVTSFRGVELRGGGEVSIRPGPAQRVTIVRGSSQFTTIRVGRNGRLKIDACNRQCPRNYDLSIVIQSPIVPDMAISGGGTITASNGFAPQARLAAAINGGGEIDFRTVGAGSVMAAINGGGTVRTGRSSTLSAAVSGGGDVRYSGNPRVSSAVQGGGSVSRDY